MKKKIEKLIFLVAKIINHSAIHVHLLFFRGFKSFNCEILDRELLAMENNETTCKIEKFMMSFENLGIFKVSPVTHIST